MQRRLKAGVMVQPLTHRLPGHRDGRRSIRHRLAAGQEVHGCLLLRGQRLGWDVGIRRLLSGHMRRPFNSLDLTLRRYVGELTAQEKALRTRKTYFPTTAPQ